VGVRVVETLQASSSVTVEAFTVESIRFAVTLLLLYCIFVRLLFTKSLRDCLFQEIWYFVDLTADLCHSHVLALVMDWHLSCLYADIKKSHKEVVWTTKLAYENELPSWESTSCCMTLS
jgi:hypothetical protein